MLISMIVAVSENGVIGRDGDMPWYLPDDLRWFRHMTLGKPVIMGRKTFDAIGKPLGRRHNIVLTRQKGWSVEDVTVVHSPDGALAAAGDVEEVMIIGGRAIYDLFLDRAQRLYVTRVHAVVEGEVTFEYDPAEWQVIERVYHEADDRHPYAFSHLTLKRHT